jgi:hypothetical protein
MADVEARRMKSLECDAHRDRWSGMRKSACGFPPAFRVSTFSEAITFMFLVDPI